MSRLLERRRRQEIPEIEVPEKFKRIPPEMEEALKKVMAGHRSPAPPEFGKSQLPSVAKVKTY